MDLGNQSNNMSAEMQLHIQREEAAYNLNKASIITVLLEKVDIPEKQRSQLISELVRILVPTKLTIA